jgi:transcriptional antiterminator Rof (Rho-off)
LVGESVSFCFYTMNVKLNSKKIVGYRVSKRVVHGRRERERIERERESCYLILGVDRSTNFSKQGMHKICQMPVDFFFN